MKMILLAGQRQFDDSRCKVVTDPSVFNRDREGAEWALPVRFFSLLSYEPVVNLF